MSNGITNPADTIKGVFGDMLAKGGDWLLDRDITTPTRTYQKYVGSVPLVESALLGTIGAVGGYMGYPKAMKAMMRVTNPNATEEELADSMEDVDSDKWTRYGVAALTGAAGAAYPALKHSMPNRSWEDTGRNWMGNYAGTTSDMLNRRERLARITNTSPTAYRGIPYQGRLNKEGSGGFSDALVEQFEGQRIPISYTLDLVESDPFLTMQAKGQVHGLVHGAEGGRSGITTGKELMFSAIRAGVGFIPAYAFSSGLAAIAGLPPTQAKTVSMAGGIAGAVYNSGILKELR